MNQEDAVKSFLDEIIQDANSGRVFVPFIGSGLSSPSGIIMGMEFTNYLSFTTYLVLCDPKGRDPTHGEGHPAHWDLREQGWPPLPASHEVGEAKKWILARFTEICKHLEWDFSESEGQIQSLVSTRKTRSALDEFVSSTSQPPIPIIIRASSAVAEEERLMKFRKVLSQQRNSSQRNEEFPWMHQGVSYEDTVVETGIRALADWRATLSFLARCRVGHDNPVRLTIGNLDPSIIDNFNATITRDKWPSLGHKIISHLSEPLRINTILTTNFDTLMEQAYRAMSIPLSVLPVSSRGDLPHPRTVSSSDSLVKLHGESHDTRADLSLDDEPSEEDKKTFSEYMKRGTGHLLKGERGRYLSSRLLVVGYSGNDHRCVQMIKYWLESAKDKSKVYWICFSENDSKRVQELFASATYSGRIRTIQTHRPDLLLYELYQRLTLSLPPGGLTYEFSHVLPPKRKDAFDYSHDKVSEIVSITDEVVQTATLHERAEVARELVAKQDKRLLRDAVVMFGQNLILKAVCPSGNAAQNLRHILGDAEFWVPRYRFLDDKQGKKTKAAIGKMKHQPMLINLSGGVVRSASLAADVISTQQYRKVFWIELQDYMDADSLLRDFLRSLSLRFGQFQAKHVTLHPLASGLPKKPKSNDTESDKDSELKLDRLVSHLENALREYRVDPSSVVVMFNGRDSYGVGAGLTISTWNLGVEPIWQLNFLIEMLARAGIPTVYFPCTEERAVRKKQFIASVSVLVGLPEDDFGPAPSLSEKESGWPHDPLTSFSKKDESVTEALAVELSVFPDIIKDALQEFYEVDAGASGIQVKLKPGLNSDKLPKLQFLYALTLFRHSRHPNAVASEGTYACPYRFQSSAIDNDFIRSVQASQWVADLRNKRVFFTKPGGALWMHRDIREAIQKIIEQTLIPPFNNKQRQNWRFREVRGRLHFWIGDWFRKAYCSSGHLTPVGESVYHLISSAVYAQYAVPKTNVKTGSEVDELHMKYRQMMFESAVVQASKMLLLAWGSIELWQASSAEVAWLSRQHREDVLAQLKASLEVIDPASWKILENIETSNGYDCEAGGNRFVACVLEFLRIHAALESAVLLEGGHTERGATSWATQSSIMTKLVPTSEILARGGASAPIVLKHGINEIGEPKDTFQGKLDKAFEDAKAGDLWFALNSALVNREKARGAFGQKKVEWKSDATAQTFQNTVWVLSEAAYVLLRRAKLEFHATGEVSRVTWLTSTLCCNLGIDLCKQLPAWSLAFETESRIKIHSIYAVGLANLGRFFEANRHLNEAHALESKWGHGGRKGHARIGIRRAEVKLTECYWISLFLSPELELRSNGEATVKIIGTKTSETFLMPAINIGATECWHSSEIADLLDANDWAETDYKQRLVPPNIFECIRQSVPVSDPSAMDYAEKWRDATQEKLRLQFSAILDEAVRCLDIAETNLGGVAQSSLWWSRLHTLRLRVFGLLQHLGADAEHCIIFRKHSADRGIFNSFVSATRIAAEDDFRRLRALRYFAEANRWYCRHRDPVLASEIQKGDKKAIEKYLPESVEVARALAKELSSKIRMRKFKENASEVRSGDLLKRAIRRTIKQFPEFK